MYKYTLKPDDAHNVAYLMKTGKDYVCCQIPYGNAVAMCEHGKIEMGDIHEFPIGVDGKYFFTGKIKEVAEKPVDEQPASEKKPQPKKKQKK